MREPKPYDVVIHEGKEARQYQDGSIRDERGRVLTRTSESARAMELSRRIKGQAAALQGLQDGAGAATPEEAWAKVIEKQTRAALTETGRAATDAARMVGKATGFIQNERHVEVAGQVNHVPQLPQLPESYLRALEKLAEEQGIVIEGEVSDDEPD